MDMSLKHLATGGAVSSQQEKLFTGSTGSWRELEVIHVEGWDYFRNTFCLFQIRVSCKKINRFSDKNPPVML